MRSAKADEPPTVFENGRAACAASTSRASATARRSCSRSTGRSRCTARRSTQAARGREAVPRARSGSRTASRVVTFGSTALAQSRLQTVARSTPTPRCAGSRHDTRRGHGARRRGRRLVRRARRRRASPGRVLILLTDGRDVRSLATLGRGRAAPRSRRTSSSTRSRSATPTAPRSRSSRGRPAAPSTRARRRGELDERLPPDRRRAEAHVADLVHDRGAPGRRDHGRASCARAGRRETVVVPGTSRRSSARGSLPGLARRQHLGRAAAARSPSARSCSSPSGAPRRCPRAARVKRLVRAHTDPRGQARRRAKRQRPTLDAPARRRSTSACAACAASSASSGSSRRPRCPVSASTVVVGAVVLAVLLVAIFAAVVAGLASAFAIVVLLRARPGRCRSSILRVRRDPAHPRVRGAAARTCSARSPARCASATA